MQPNQTDFHKLLIDILHALVDHPGDVLVTVNGADPLCYQIQVATLDLGKVIGKQGRTARALRLLASSHGQRIKQRISIEIATQPAR